MRLGVILDGFARDGLAPYLAFETAHRHVRGTGEEHLAQVDDGHVAAQFHHVLDDVRGQDHDDVVADLREQVVEAVPFAGIEAGRGLVDDQQAEGCR